MTVPSETLRFGLTVRAVADFLLDLGNFIDPPLVAAAGKLSGQPGLDNLLGQLWFGLGAAQNQDIGVVMFAARTGAIDIRYQRRTHAGKFIGDDRHADTAGADQHAALGLASRNPL